MKHYRLGYDYMFLAHDPFTHNDETIGGLTIFVLFKVFDADGNEKLFAADELADQKLYLENGSSYWLTSLIHCSISKEKGMHFTPDLERLKDSGYTIQFEIDSYFKNEELGPAFLDSKEIPRDEFMQLLNTYIDRFDNSDNRPAQSTAYFTKEIHLSPVTI
ncbi:hypothetical protein [Fictibacillus sp. NRS-1165]|uniref:hypothetical protein n=1 Tax=Fictibacillus sp. NRS-1165 TaxID=3144463 RepID=UPI003D1B58A1